MARPKVDLRVGRMLHDFDVGMYIDYSRKTTLFRDKSKKMADLLPHVIHEEWKTSSGEKVPVFYVKFNEPVYMVLNNPLSLFRTQGSRRAGIKRDGYFYRYGLVPVYFASMSTMSVLKLHSVKVGKIFDPAGTFFEGVKCIRLENKKGSGDTNHVKFSSFNIIEQGASKENLADDTVSDWFYKLYFTYGFWLQPRRGFVPSTHIEYKRKIHAVFKLSKSIYAVDHLEPHSKDVTIAGKEITVYDADVRGILVDTMSFGRPFKARIEASILDELTEMDPKKFPLLNGMMMEVRDKAGMKDRDFEEILTVNAGYGRTYSDIIRLAMGMYCYSVCRENSPVSRLHDTKTFKSRVEMYCKDWMKELSTDGTPESGADYAFYAALDGMFPMLVADESSVYFTHPLVIGFMKKWGVVEKPAEFQKSFLLLLLPVLETIAKIPWKDKRRISRDDDYRELAKTFNKDGKLVSSLIKLAKEIRLSNLIRKTYQTDFSGGREQE